MSTYGSLGGGAGLENYAYVDDHYLIRIGPRYRSLPNPHTRRDKYKDFGYSCCSTNLDTRTQSTGRVYLKEEGFEGKDW